MLPLFTLSVYPGTVADTLLQIAATYAQRRAPKELRKGLSVSFSTSASLRPSLPRYRSTFCGIYELSLVRINLISWISSKLRAALNLRRLVMQMFSNMSRRGFSMIKATRLNKRVNNGLSACSA